jgi:hypothetical protein
MYRTVRCVLAILALVVAAQNAWADDRAPDLLPIPSAAQQGGVKKTIQELYKDDYKKPTEGARRSWRDGCSSRRRILRTMP